MWVEVVIDGGGGGGGGGGWEHLIGRSRLVEYLRGETRYINKCILLRFG